MPDKALLPDYGMELQELWKPRQPWLKWISLKAGKLMNSMNYKSILNPRISQHLLWNSHEESLVSLISYFVEEAVDISNYERIWETDWRK